MSESIDASILEYLTECDELLVRVSDNLRLIEKSGYVHDVVDSIYRDIHTLKGSSQLFGFIEIGELTHAFENCLDGIRRHKIQPSPSLFEAFYKSLDAIEQMLSAIKEKSTEGFQPLINSLLPLLTQNNDAPAALAPAPAVVAPTPVAIVPAPEAPPAPAAAAPAGESADAPNSVRVSVSLLDKLMALTGEMVLVRNQVLQYANSSDDLEFLNLSQHLDVVTSEIQGEVMKTRMQPIGTVLSKFHRVVRDLARELNKRIELNLVGVETELDKTLIEAIKDPVMHILRNSCDHGVETLDERRQVGKTDAGTVTVKAFHEGGQVVIEISDDGRGLRSDRLIAKAVEKGLITKERASTYTEREAFNLIFAPGFSTAAAVTNVSGRGVGMDVVKTNIEGIGGLVEIQSQPNVGTTTRLKIPLTLAIVPAMIIRSKNERFAIPQVKLVELVRLERHGSGPKIESLQGRPVVRLRERLLPLVQLDEVMGLPCSPASDLETANVVVLNAEGQLFGLIVDEVLDTAEVVVKPLSSFLKSLTTYSGATVLGDGSVALILDVVGMAKQQHLLNEATKVVSVPTEEPRKVESQEFLLFRLNSPTKHALPLGLVHRLEEVAAAAVEFAGAQRVIRYRNSALPILSLNALLGYAEPTSVPDRSALIVSQKSGRLLGIEVSEILDVLTTDALLQDSVSENRGIMGTVTIENEIVVVVDALGLMEKFITDVTGGVPEPKYVAQNLPPQNASILFAEDTTFFRRHVAKVLNAAGFKLTIAEDGAQALQILEDAPAGSFDMVLSDIEMPKMNGLQLAKAVRANQRWAHLPMIAITTKYSDADVLEGTAAGFNMYLEKLNPEKLLAGIGHVLGARGEVKKAS